jgi:tripartite-type tricarboxylate transporter receptor subunit TctC
MQTRTPIATVTAAALIACSVLSTTAAYAQAYPSKAVRMIVPFAPGGGTDIQARLLSRKFQESTGQTFIVDNRPTANGMLGAELAAKAVPDGYTILFMSAALAVNATLIKKLPFDPAKDLEGVSLVSSVPLVLVVHPSLPVKNPKELAALSKKTKTGLNGGSNGNGTTSHLSLEMFRQMAGLNVTHIPYKGSGPAVTALMSGEYEFSFPTALAAMPHMKSGKLRGLAVTTAKKASSMPELPTMASFYPGFDTDNWYGMFVPAKTPKDVNAKLNAEILKALKASDVREFMAREGGEPVGTTPEEMTAYFKHEVEKFAKVIKAGNISVD